MADTGSPYSLRYPLGSSDVDIADDIKRLAQDVHASLETKLNLTGNPTINSNLTVTGTINDADIRVGASGTSINLHGGFPVSSTGQHNIAAGVNALAVNTYGFGNIAFGHDALAANTGGYYNVAIGRFALTTPTDGSENVAVGVMSLRYTTSGYSNAAFGYAALYGNTTGYANNAQGSNALFANTTGYVNCAVGASALRSNTVGNENTAVGSVALYNNISGSLNTAIGREAQKTGTAYSYVTAIGAKSDVDGDYGIAIGYGATTIGAGGVAIGVSSVGVAATAGADEIVLGTTAHTVSVPGASVELGVSGPTITTGTGTPEGVVTAPVGSIWFQTDSTVGVTHWRKATGTGNTGWVVMQGDTGYRSIAASLENGWAGGYFYIRRTNDIVRCYGYLSGVSATSGVMYTLPTGFKGNGPETAISVLGTSSSATTYGVVRVETDADQVKAYGTYTNNNLLFDLTWSTKEAWPTTLPGVAA